MYICLTPSYFWLLQVSHRCQAWAVWAKSHLHGPVSLVMQLSLLQYSSLLSIRWSDLEKKKKKAIYPSKLVLDALKCVSLGSSLWPFCCGELHFFHKYEDVLLIRMYLLLQQDPVYYVSKTEARLELSSGGQWFYTYLISYQTVLGVR